MRGLTQHQLFMFLIQFTLLLASARAIGALARRLQATSSHRRAARCGVVL